MLSEHFGYLRLQTDMRNLLLSTFVLMGTAGLAQEYTYVPFPKENARWNVDAMSMDCPPYPALCGQGTFAAAGDTLINGVGYTRINDVYLGQITSTTFYLFREDTAQRKVFGLWSGEEYLVYDFSLSVGDTFRISHPTVGVEESYVIQGIDTVLVGNSLRKRFNFGGPQSLPESYYWIEGIGGGAGPFMSHYIFESWSVLRCFSVGDELLFSSPMSYPPQYLLELYPWYEYCDTRVIGILEELEPGSAAVLTVNGIQMTIPDLGGESSNYVLYSLLGQRLMSGNLTDDVLQLPYLPTGIYFLQLHSRRGETVFKVIFP